MNDGPEAIRHDRFRALERMAAAVTHDFNNDLAIIAGVTDLLLGDGAVAPTPDPERAYLQMIRRATDDATALIGRLRAFHRPQGDPRSLTRADLGDVVAEAVTACTATATEREATPPDIRLSWDPSQPVYVYGDRDDLRQAAVELILNAIEACHPGKPVWVSCESPPDGPRLIVQDGGEGMASSVVDRCFEPFYTTRHGHGRGMGLAIVHGAVRRHGGHVSIESRIGEGTKVTISLPPASASSTRDADDGESTRVGLLRVLVVDDNPAVRAVVEAFLVGDGHEVEIAANTGEALQKIQDGRYDLILTDQSMPGQSGSDLASAVKKASLNLPVILMTGFDLDRDSIEDSGAVDLVLHKPLTRAALRAALATVVAASRE
jgi:CheY-like chemotaxis protein